MDIISKKLIEIENYSPKIEGKINRSSKIRKHGDFNNFKQNKIIFLLEAVVGGNYLKFYSDISKTYFLQALLSDR